MTEEKTEVHIPDKWSWWDKLKWCYTLLRYGNDAVRYWRIISCECCGHYEIVYYPQHKKSYDDPEGYKVFENVYRCLHCGAVGVTHQTWYKEEKESAND